jgi:hypothetical protein
MQQYFDRVIDRILEFLGEQMETAKRERQTISVGWSLGIHVCTGCLTLTQKIVLVGGFGASRYFKYRVEQWAGENYKVIYGQKSYRP